MRNINSRLLVIIATFMLVATTANITFAGEFKDKLSATAQQISDAWKSVFTNKAEGFIDKKSTDAANSVLPGQTDISFNFQAEDSNVNVSTTQKNSAFDGALSGETNVDVKLQKDNNTVDIITKQLHYLFNKTLAGKTEISAKLQKDNANVRILTVQPMLTSDDMNSILLFQGSFGTYKQYNELRPTINVGIGKRWLIRDKKTLLGINGFFDYETKYEHTRHSLGVEYRNSNFSANYNKYFNSSSSVRLVLDDVDKIYEEVLGGNDLILYGKLPYVPWASLRLESYKWVRDDDTKNGNLQGYKLGFDVDFTEDISFEIGADNEHNSDVKAYGEITMKLPLSNKRIAHKIDRVAWRELQDMTNSLRDKIERNNQIVVNRYAEGIFIDAIVDGLNYTSTNYIGKTKNGGRYRYDTNDNCLFNINSVSLGQVKCATRITPYTLAGTTKANATAAQRIHAGNIAMLLQNIDINSALDVIVIADNALSTQSATSGYLITATEDNVRTLLGDSDKNISRERALAALDANIDRADGAITYFDATATTISSNNNNPAEGITVTIMVQAKDGGNYNVGGTTAVTLAKTGSSVLGDTTGNLINGRFSTTLYNRAPEAVTITGTIDGENIGMTTIVSFSTDTIAPTIISTTPANNTDNIARNANIILNFSENIEVNNASITIFGGGATLNIAASGASVVITDNIATIMPNMLASGASYTITIPNTVFADKANTANALEVYTFAFTTNDDVAPILLSFTPTNGASKVLANQSIVLTFDEIVFAGIGAIEIRANGSIVESINASSSKVTGLGTTEITINPANTSASSTTYSVKVNSDFVKDESDNNYNYIDTAFSFLSLDTQPPEFVRVSSGTSNLLLTGASITLVFNENIALGSGDINIVSHDTGATVNDHQISTATISGNTANIVLGTLSSDASYYINIPAGFFVDSNGNSNGNPFAGISDDTTIVFTSLDTVGPRMVSYTPNGLSADASTNELTITFDEPVTIIGSDNITIVSGSNSSNIIATIAPASITISPTDNKTVNIDITGAIFNVNQQYVVNVPAGLLGDVAGNENLAITGNTNIKFTVARGSLPTLSGSTPADDTNSVGLDDNIILRFDRGVYANNGATLSIVKTSDSSSEIIAINSPRVTFSNNNTVVTIDPVNAFESATSYYINISANALSSSAGNFYAGINNAAALNFTTRAIAIPVLANTNPYKNTVGVPTSDNIVLIFNEDIRVATAGNVVIKTSAGTIFESISSSSTSFSINGRELTINPNKHFANGVVYYIELPSTLLENTSGNGFAGISDSSVVRWTTTTDNEPTLISTTPDKDNNILDASKYADIVMTFSESVSDDGGNIYLYNNQDNTQAVEFAISGPSITINGGVVNIDVGNSLINGKQYYILVDESALQDSTGSRYIGISDTEEFGFTVAGVDSTNPIVLLSNATTVNANSATTTIVFDRNIANITHSDIILSSGGANVTNSSNIAVSINNNILTIVYDSLNADAAYSATLSGSSITASGNSSVNYGEITLSFTTTQ